MGDNVPGVNVTLAVIFFPLSITHAGP